MSAMRKHHARFFKDEDFEFLAEIALGAAYHRGADVGECLVTFERIKSGDAESWFAEWTALGERVAGIAREAEDAGRLRSAADAWLRAATYLDTASAFLDSTKDPDRMRPAWEKHREAWDGFVRCAPEVEAVSIPYEGTALDGWVFRSDVGEGPRPLLILNNGSDGPASAMWMQGAAGGLARGYDCLSFDGPGQGSALWRLELPFRPDWEAVITPVVDFALTLDGIDPRRIALHGVSQGGYWVPRAVAFEDRIAAAVADPGVWDVQGSWLAHIPKSLQKQLADGERDKFNRSMDWGTRFSASTRGTLAFRMRPFMLETPFDVYKALEDYNLADVAERITCPILLTNPENEQFWPGDAERLYDAVSTPPDKKAIVDFTAAEGADSHCEPRALGLRDQRVFDWLDGILGTGDTG